MGRRVIRALKGVPPVTEASPGTVRKNRRKPVAILLRDARRCPPPGQRHLRLIFRELKTKTGQDGYGLLSLVGIMLEPAIGVLALSAVLVSREAPGDSGRSRRAVPRRHRMTAFTIIRRSLSSIPKTVRVQPRLLCLSECQTVRCHSGALHHRVRPDPDRRRYSCCSWPGGFSAYRHPHGWLPRSHGHIWPDLLCFGIWPQPVDRRLWHPVSVHLHSRHATSAAACCSCRQSCIRPANCRTRPSVTLPGTPLPMPWN